MFLKIKTFFRSIRFKFILWYILILAVTFSIFSLILYYNLGKSLHENLDDLLISKAESVTASIDTYWETEKINAAASGIAVNVFSKINNINFVKIAERWVEEKSQDPELFNIIVQILNPKGEIIAFSKNQPADIFSKDNLKFIFKGKSIFYNKDIFFEEAKNTHFRIFATPVLENGKIAYIVQVASPMTSIDTALSRLRLILFFLLPLTVFLTSIIAGEFLVSITLRPLKKMMATVSSITAQNLQLRVNIPNSKDEIKQLAETFNNMLEKIDKSFVSQKQFIQDVSHELRTPLTIIKGQLEVALKKSRSQEEYSQTLRSNLEEIDKITRIVDNLLMLIRFDSEEVTLSIEPVDIAELINNLLAEMAILTNQKSQKIEFLRQENSYIINADKEKLRRIFCKILDNAIKYTPTAGQINLEIKEKKDFLEIKISDTGKGIPEENLPFIFDRFYRVDKSRALSGGFGLGLSIAKSIASIHGGRIEAESQLDKGTTFSIFLPRLTKPIK